MYRTNEYSVYQQGWDVIYDMDRIKSIDENISVKSFQGVNGILHEIPSMKDSVYVYQKKK